MQEGQDVDRAAEVSVVLTDTATDVHSSEHRRVDDDRLLWETLSNERLRQAVDAGEHQICGTQQNAVPSHILK